MLSFLTGVCSSAIEALDQEVPFSAEVAFRLLTIVPVLWFGIAVLDRVQEYEIRRCEALDHVSVADREKLRQVVCPGYVPREDASVN